MKFTEQETKDLISAITEAQAELCTDYNTRSGSFPEATAYAARLEALKDRLRNERCDD